ncbi:hypothetical protein B0H21DRAFT_690647 [Amylocystis lapponica]|nr:hypothetical protein B0H21DRAFT_690647 [Amylocystis lapponica]
MQHALSSQLVPSDFSHPPHGLRPPAPDVAMRPHSDPSVPLRPPSPPATPRRPAPPVHAPNSAPSKSISARGGPASLQPAPPSRQRSASVPPPNETTVQCSGTTRSDARCQKRVRVRTPLARLGADADAELPQYCHQHAKKVLQPTCFRLRVVVHGRDKVEFKDWIPEYLQAATQANLRVEMERPLSDADVDGYIYAFEIRDLSAPDQLSIKVGRAVKVTKRIEQWSKQCGSKEQILYGFWPWNVPADQVTFMKGRVRVGKAGKWCHRVERLVHLELADLAMNEPYLDPHFPNVQVSDTGTSARAVQRKPCEDCGTVHREIFTFTRAQRGRFKNQEWDLIVKPVIEKWGRFVEQYLRREAEDE